MAVLEKVAMVLCVERFGTEMRPSKPTKKHHTFPIFGAIWNALKRRLIRFLPPPKFLAHHFSHCLVRHVRPGRRRFPSLFPPFHSHFFSNCYDKPIILPWSG